MKSNLTLKYTISLLSILASSICAQAGVFTASASGNFSSSSTWGGGAVPGFNFTTGDQIVINSGISVNLDQDMVINNLSAQLTVDGTLSGTHSLDIENGTLSGAATGSLSVHNLTLGGGSSSSFLGSMTADNFYNVESHFSLTGDARVNDTIALSGMTLLTSGTTLTLGSGATMMLAGGSYNTSAGGTISQLGGINLFYSAASDISTGPELSLDNINNVTVNMNDTGYQVNMTRDLAVGGHLCLQKGHLSMNGYNLTLNGIVDTLGTGTLAGHPSSNLILGGSAAYNGRLMFAPGNNMINNLTISSTNGSFTHLGTDLSVGGRLTLGSGSLNLTGTSNLRLTGTDSIVGGSQTSFIATSGTGSLIVPVAGGSSSDNVRTLPIGTQGSYAPVTVTNSSSTSGNFSGSAHSGIWLNGTSGADLSQSRTGVVTSWYIESDITSGANVSIEAYWNQAAEVNNFTRNSAWLSHYTNSAWDSGSYSAATIHAGGLASVKRSGITSFSPFAVFGIAAPATTGITDPKTQEPVHTYPNPGKNIITVSVSDPRSTDMKVYDLLGNQVANYPVRTGNNAVDISSLNTGVYLLSVDNRTEKFIKQ